MTLSAARMRRWDAPLRYYQPRRYVYLQNDRSRHFEIVQLLPECFCWVVLFFLHIRVVIGDQISLFEFDSLVLMIRLRYYTSS